MNDLNNMKNLYSINIDTFIKKASSMVEEILKKGYKLKDIPSIMLWGAPGVGKSDGVKELAEILEKRLSKQVKVIDIRLLLFNPVDLRGLPTITSDKSKTIWIRPEILNLDTNNEVINILFLDEITAAPQSVQAAAYQITLDRRIGEHILPDNTIIIAAGNRKKDMSFSNTMSKALANRFLHFNIEPDFEEWKEWAIKNNINMQVVGFLDYKTNYFNYGIDEVDEVAYASPRSWERVSFILNTLGGSIFDKKEIIAGLVGRGITEEFFAYVRLFDEIPDVDAIINGSYNDVPERADILWSLICAISEKLNNHIKSGNSISNICKYAMKLPLDFSLVFYRNVSNIIKREKIEMLTDIDFEAWGELLNSNI